MAETKVVAQATMSMAWDHPRLGRIRELLCESHERAVLAAVHTLGIGCMGERFTGAVDCNRCVADALGVAPRDYVRLTSTSGESL